MPHSKTLLIFDVDGTLLYSNRVDSQCFAETYEVLFGKPFPSINWLDYPHVTDTTIFSSVFRDQFGRDVEFDQLELFKKRFVDRLREARKTDPGNFQEVPGARSLLEFLSASENFSLGVATGGFELPARFKLGHLGMSIDGFHLSFADGKATREAIIEDAIRQAEAAEGRFNRIVYIGDAVWDVRTTRRLNMPFIGVRRKGDEHLLIEEGARFVLRDFRNVPQFLDHVQRAVPPAERRL